MALRLSAASCSRNQMPCSPRHATRRWPRGTAIAPATVQTAATTKASRIMVRSSGRCGFSAVAAAWSISAVDEKLGLVYIPLGSSSPDIWGGGRSPEKERYDSALIALDVMTGKLRWSFQNVHHDLWAQPTYGAGRPIVTAGGVISSQEPWDDFIRAFDTRWETALAGSSSRRRPVSADDV
jgi:hypothetical protein